MGLSRTKRIVGIWIERLQVVYLVKLVYTLAGGTMRRERYTSSSKVCVFGFKDRPIMFYYLKICARMVYIYFK